MTAWLSHLPAWAQLPVEIGVMVVSVGVIGYLFVQAWQARRRTLKPNKRPEFEGTAIPGTGRVLQWTPAVGSGFLSYDIQMRVQAPGRQPYEVTVRQRVPVWLPHNRAACRPNVIVSVQIDSTDPRNVWVDFKEPIFEDAPGAETGSDTAMRALLESVNDPPGERRTFRATDRHGRPVQVCLTSDGVAVDRRPGDVFSLADPMVGVWSPERYDGTRMGTALHLACQQAGGHTFVLGGRDHRIGNGTRLRAEPRNQVDAWLCASDFEEFLTAISGRGALDIRRPGPGEPTRCHLIPVDPGGQRPPYRALDLGKDEISVIDPYTNDPIATAWCADVVAIPANYTYNPNAEMGGGWSAPVLILHVGGAQPLTVRPVTIRTAKNHGVFGTQAGRTRFSWRGRLPRAKYSRSENMKDGPAYGVADEDWLMLAEKFDWARFLEDRDNPD